MTDPRDIPTFNADNVYGRNPDLDTLQRMLEKPLGGYSGWMMHVQVLINRCRDLEAEVAALKASNLED